MYGACSEPRNPLPGANGSQSAPVLSFASVTASEVTISGSLNAAINDYYRIEFYAESGGQVGDTGVLVGPNGRFQVADTKKTGDVVLHFGGVLPSRCVEVEARFAGGPHVVRQVRPIELPNQTLLIFQP